MHQRRDSPAAHGGDCGDASCLKAMEHHGRANKFQPVEDPTLHQVEVF